MDSADAPVIVALVEKLESAYQAIVEDVLENSKEDIFKKMRRVLPVTGQKFDWNATKAVMS